jgi:hypothetical protein
LTQGNANDQDDQNNYDSDESWLLPVYAHIDPLLQKEERKANH